MATSWRRHKFHVPFQIAAAGLCFFWWLRPPAPNKAVLAIGVVAVIMALSEMTPAHKAGWLVIVFILAFVENKAIDRDRVQFAKDQAEARQLERDQFARVLDQNQHEFTATTGRMESLFNATKDVEELTRQNLANITGGDSFGFIVPQVDGTQDVPLIVWNHGGQVLSGVTITISRTQDPNWGREFYRPIFIGTIGPHDHAPVPISLIPKPDEKSGQDHYWIMISAQNGTVSQSLWFRVRKDGKLPWAYSYLVSKHVTLHKRRGPIPKGSQLMEPLLRRLWSDEVEAPH